MIQLWTDGACSNNQERRNYGGWGCAILGEDCKLSYEGYDGAIDTTNNIMEMKACIEGLKYLSESKCSIPIEIYSDSAYICNCMNAKWYEGWRRNGWRNSKKEPVKNKELWEALLAVLAEILEANPFGMSIKFVKVKGHSGIEMNEYVDGLANKGVVIAQSIERTS
jgi:ribonuclease HI